MANQKSLMLSYFFLLCGGLIGLHHFYLRRDRHAFLYWSTIGGLWGLGCVRDLWRLPEYVRQANCDLTSSNGSNSGESKIKRKKKTTRASFTFIRFCAQVIVGYIYGLIAYLATPTDYSYSVHFAYVFMALGMIVATHTIGNVGNHQLLLKPIILTYLITLLTLCIYIGHENYGQVASLTTLVGSPIVSLYTTLRSPHAEAVSYRSVIKRWIILCFAGCLYTSALGSAIYHHATIRTEDGETIQVKEAIHHFFSSPLWLEFKDVLNKLYQYGKVHGWQQAWKEFNMALDPEGESHALKILELRRGATESQIRRQYKKLIVKWHPDKNRNNLLEAEKKSMEINQAYQILSTIQSRRNPNRTTNMD